MRRNFFVRVCFTVTVAAWLAGCEAQKSSNPLSPNIAGPIAGVEITTPRTLEPASGVKVKMSQQPVRLVIENASTNGVRPVSYTFDVATDSGFESRVFTRSGVTPGPNGRTEVVLEPLAGDRRYYWRARAEDGANSSQYSSSTFDVLPAPLLGPPPQLAPVDNVQLANRRPDLVVGMAPRNSAVGEVSYEFQISVTAAFSALAASGSRGEGGGNTTFSTDGDLAASTTYFWRVRARDEDVTSTWSAVQSFRTAAAAPAPPAPGPSPAPGGVCNSSSPQAIVECERAKYGYMDRNQLVEFLRAVARSLNRNGIAGGPYGILRKQSGNQCGGYSCDIICAGQGTAQRQHDVLGDVEGAQTPGWSSAHTWPDIRIDVCEIQ